MSRALHLAPCSSVYYRGLNTAWATRMFEMGSDGGRFLTLFCGTTFGNDGQKTNEGAQEIVLRQWDSYNNRLFPATSTTTHIPYRCALPLEGVTSPDHLY